MEAQPVKTIERVSLGPDDVLVITHKDSISPDQAQFIRSRVEDVFPDHKVLVLSGGLKLHVIGKHELA
jgi:hypothetical protein